jgi:hypothetical protein
MIHHVLPGDSLVEEFSKTGLEGEIIVCREALIVGPISAENHDEFWDERAKFILTDYGEDEIEFQEKVANELERLAEISADDEVNLWFEYELFCQVNMWFCISRLADSGAEIYRVEPSVIAREDRWKGFGGLPSGDLVKCFEARTKLSDQDIDLGKRLWKAYQMQDSSGLADLANTSSPAFPYLDETAAAASEIDTKPHEILRTIRSEGMRDREAIFVEFSRRAGVYGFGDLQVYRLLDQLSA